jgi:CHAT domain-containing protein
VPAIVPSLHSLILLWQRPTMAPFSPTSGLLVAVGSFQERYPPLPAVTAEAKVIAAHLGPGSRRLQAAEATWLNLQQVAGEDGLAPFAFLHVASHAFHDPITGRLSGLALYDRDIWLDEVTQLAPLPSLVTFSACSGSQSRIYEGDEHVGLVTACLASGAQSVVGSLWPIEDADTADLMLNFYEQRLAGRRVAHALALAQRRAWRLGSHIIHWGSFRCTGQP